VTRGEKRADGKINFTAAGATNPLITLPWPKDQVPRALAISAATPLGQDKQGQGVASAWMGAEAGSAAGSSAHSLWNPLGWPKQNKNCRPAVPCRPRLSDRAAPAILGGLRLHPYALVEALSRERTLEFQATCEAPRFCGGLVGASQGSPATSHLRRYSHRGRSPSSGGEQESTT
jgi:hypothetical protein